MTFDRTKPYHTRNGRKAEIIYTMKDGRFVVVYGEGEDCSMVFPTGRRYTGSVSNSDLVNLPEKRVVVINHYTDGYDSLHHTLASAEECASDGCYGFTVLEYERPV